MIKLEEKLAAFEQAVMDDALSTRDEILLEVDTITNSEIRQTEESVLAESYELIQKNIQSIKSDIRLNLSKKELQTKRELLNYREELVNTLFTDCKQELIAYAESIDYLTTLKTICSDFKKQCDCTNAKVFVKKSDLKYAAEISAVLGTDVSVLVDDSIEIGGIKLSTLNGSVLFDETLDTRLLSQRNEFIKQSGLTI